MNISSGTVRIDFCELTATDDKGARTGVTIDIATGVNAAAFARHWHAACAGSLQPDARGGAK